MGDATRELFNAMRRLIPDIPENSTRLTLHLRMDSIPVIECEFIVKKAIGIETHEQRFTLKAIENSLVAR